LNIKVLFWYHPADYWAFKAFNEQLLLSIMERYAAEGLDFAVPSQTLYLKENAQE
jgi:myo-inositol catabolism protein IolC